MPLIGKGVIAGIAEADIEEEGTNVINAVHLLQAHRPPPIPLHQVALIHLLLTLDLNRDKKMTRKARAKDDAFD